MRDQPDAFIPTRESLLSRLKDWDDQQSWRDFFDTYGKLIYGLAVKSGLTDAEAQDALQETLIAVAKEMPAFKYNPAIGSFKGWLLEVARRRIANQIRKRAKGGQPSRSPRSGATPDPGSSDDRTATVERIPDPNRPELEVLWEQEWQKNLLEVALVRIKKRVDPKQYQMFNLYAVQRCPMELVKSTLGVNAAQVYMAKMRIGRLIKKEIAALEKAHR